MNGQFIVPPTPWLPVQEIAPSPSAPPASTKLAGVLQRFERWPGLTPVQRSRLLRDGSIVLARSAGLSHHQIAEAAGVVRSRVGEILGDFDHA